MSFIDYQFTVPVTGMHCASCAAGLEHQLNRIPGISNVNVNIATHEAHVEGVALESVVEIIKKAGYDVARSELLVHVQDGGPGLTQESIDARCMAAGPLVQGKRLDQSLNLSWIPGTITTETILCLFPEYTGTAVKKSASFASEHTRLILAVVGAVVLMGLTMFEITTYNVLLLIATPIIFYCGAEFFRGAWAAFRRGTANMYSLIAIGVGAAWVYSTIATLFPSLFSTPPSVYFEASAVIVALVLVGLFLESRALKQTGSAIEALLRLQVPVACVQRGPHLVDVPVEAIKTGDLVIIRMGDQVPVDGEIVGGCGIIDESMLTGEPFPVTKSTGDSVVGGTLNIDGSLIVRVTHTGRDTVLQQILRMTREAQGRKAPIQKMADRVSSIFVPVVLMIAGLTFTAWIIAGGSLEHALTTFVSVLIIACPCALGLATPAAVVAATGASARRGILFKGGDALERVSRVTHIVLDKTGTLTTGKPEIQSVEVSAESSVSEVLQMAASLEAHSRHPLAEAVVTKAKREGIDFSPAESIETHLGKGISGVIQKQEVCVGSSIFLSQKGIALPPGVRLESRIHIAVDGQWAGQFTVTDPIRSTSRDTIDYLRQQNLTVTMLTGDVKQNAMEVAYQMGIDEVHAGKTPEEKLEFISLLGEQGAVTAMVGDGVNDAPALAQADVGLAIGSGTQVAIETSDVTLLREDLKSVAETIMVGRKAMKTIRQNLFFAFMYNTLSIPVAAGAFYGVFGILLNPMLASLAMMLSSLSVVLNSLRLSSKLKL